MRPLVGGLLPSSAWAAACIGTLAVRDVRSSRDGLMVLGGALSVCDVESEGAVEPLEVVASLSAGIGRVVTTWVTSFEKNFTSACDGDAVGSEQTLRSTQLR